MSYRSQWPICSQPNNPRKLRASFRKTKMNEIIFWDVLSLLKAQTFIVGLGNLFGPRPFASQHAKQLARKSVCAGPSRSLCGQQQSQLHNKQLNLPKKPRFRPILETWQNSAISECCWNCTVRNCFSFSLCTVVAKLRPSAVVYSYAVSRVPPAKLLL